MTDMDYLLFFVALRTHRLQEVCCTNSRLTVTLLVVNSHKLILLDVSIKLLQRQMFAEGQPV